MIDQTKSATSAKDSAFDLPIDPIQLAKMVLSKRPINIDPTSSLMSGRIKMHTGTVMNNIHTTFQTNPIDLGCLSSLYDNWGFLQVSVGFPQARSNPPWTSQRGK